MSTFNTIMAVILRNTIAKYTILVIKLKKLNEVKNLIHEYYICYMLGMSKNIS
jgi:hypothetical protein